MLFRERELGTLSAQLAAAVPEHVWAPTWKLFQEHSQKLSGEQLWQKRKAVLDRLSEARATVQAHAA